MKPEKPADWITASLFGLILVFTAWVWISPVGISPAPDINLVSLQGKKLNPARFGKRPLLVTFWATTCATCVAEMPHLREIWHDYNKAGFDIIGISMYYDRPDHVAATVKHRKLPYPIVIDLNRKVMQAFGMKRPLTPTTYLISPDGRIVYHKIGKLRIRRLRRKIESMLTQSGARYTKGKHN